MSNISTAHDVVKYDAKSSKPFDGQRLAKVCFKTSKKSDVKPDNKAVSIPPVQLTDEQVQANDLRLHINAWIETVQDAIVRERVENGALTICDSDIDLASCIAWMDEDSKGNRLTKEYILQWFADTLADVLTVAISDKLGLSDTPNEAETKRVGQMIAVYRDSFASLAGGKTAFSVEKATKMRKVLELCSDDALAQKFDTRLTKMQEIESVELLDL